MKKEYLVNVGKSINDTFLSDEKSKTITIILLLLNKYIIIIFFKSKILYIYTINKIYVFLPRFF